MQLNVKDKEEDDDEGEINTGKKLNKKSNPQRIRVQHNYLYLITIS